MDNTYDQMKPNIDAETDRPIWRQIVLQGNADQVQSMIKYGIPADLPLDVDNPHSPIFELAQHYPKNKYHARKLGEVARVLILQSSPLTLRDYKRLLPLDYALTGPNSHVSEEIFINTLRGYFHDQKYNAPIRPRLGIIFATIADDPSRLAACNRMQVNLGAMRKRLDQTLKDGDPHIIGLPPEELAFWHELKIPSLEDLPAASQDLRAQFAKITTLSEQHTQTHEDPQKQSDIAELLKNARAEYRSMEWSIVKDMKP